MYVVILLEGTLLGRVQKVPEQEKKEGQELGAMFGSAK